MRTNRVLRTSVLALVVCGSLGSVGCESMNHTEKGAAIGGALGTATGLGLGALTGSPRTGAVIGGLAGAGIGGLAGSEKDDKERHERDVINANAVATAQAQAQQQRLGVADIMHMAQQGHDDTVIINQIRTTNSTFQLAPSDLDMLKNNGVSARVIAEMQNARPAAGSNVVVRGPQPSTTVIYQDPVVYPAPVYVRPYPYYWGPPRPPVVFVGGYYRR